MWNVGISVPSFVYKSERGGGGQSACGGLDTTLQSYNIWCISV